MGLSIVRLAVAGALFASILVSGCSGDAPSTQTQASLGPAPGADDVVALSPATPSGSRSIGGDTVELYSPGPATSQNFASYQGGPTIPNVHLQLIFWGADWS